MPDSFSREVRALFNGANYAHLATLMKDGSPHSMAVWAGLEGDRIVICTGDATLKARNARRDPRVAISITDHQNPFRTAMIRGRVVEQRADDDGSLMDVLSRKYTGNPFPMRGKGRIALIIEPESVRFTALPFEHQPG